MRGQGDAETGCRRELGLCSAASCAPGPATTWWGAGRVPASGNPTSAAERPLRAAGRPSCPQRLSARQRQQGALHAAWWAGGPGGNSGRRSGRSSQACLGAQRECLWGREAPEITGTEGSAAVAYMRVEPSRAEPFRL